jgi:CRISPR system Cascade subunit CasC
MFGRMTTSSPFKDIDAAVQVAHALSTHKVEQEFDYFTAMEDKPKPGAVGASFIGDVAFNSATYYKYINIHWEELVKNLGDHRDVAASAVEALLRGHDGHPQREAEHLRCPQPA